MGGKTVAAWLALLTKFFSRFTLLFTLSPLLSLQDHSTGHFNLSIFFWVGGGGGGMEEGAN